MNKLYNFSYNDLVLTNINGVSMPNNKLKKKQIFIRYNPMIYVYYNYCKELFTFIKVYIENKFFKVKSY